MAKKGSKRSGGGGGSKQRKYTRDNNGRFASTGTGATARGGKPKAASTRSTNTARAKALQVSGTTAIGGRVKAKGFAGGKAAQQRAGGLRASGTTSAKALAFTVGKGGKQSAAQKSATKASVRQKVVKASRQAQAGKPMARTPKAPANAAKARYKQLSSTARKSSANRSADENRAAAGAKRSLKAMVAKRGRIKPKPKPRSMR